MKKLLVLALFLVALSPGMASAQTLTKDEVRALSPQLISLSTSVSTVVPSVINARYAAQNSSLNSYSVLLRDMSLRLSSPNPLTSQELESMGKVVSGIQAQVSAIASWRAEANVAVANIVSILVKINGIVASAV